MGIFYYWRSDYYCLDLSLGDKSMLNLTELTAFLGWCLVINTGFLLISGGLLLIMRDWLISIHSKMVGVPVDSLPTLYFQYFANYKIGVILLNFTPYIALKMMV